MIATKKPGVDAPGEVSLTKQCEVFIVTDFSVVKPSLTDNFDSVTPSGNHKPEPKIVRANRDNGRRLVDSGLAVFPVHVTPDKKKRPIASAWTQLDSELTDEQRAAVIADFRKEHDGREPAYIGATNNRFGLKKIGQAIDPWRTPYGWSISTGPSGLFVIDCDGAEAVEWFREFCEESDIDLSQCPQVKTQSGGWHVYFADEAASPTRTAAGLKRWKSGDGKRVAGIDLRAAGGQTVSPNTILTDGREYAAIEGTPDLATAFAAKAIPAVPQVLLDWVAANRSKAKTNVDDIEIAKKLRAEIDGAPILSFDEIVTPIGDLDFESALSGNARLRVAWESDADGDRSSARMALANHLAMAFPGKLTASHYAAFLSEFKSAGTFDPEKRKRPTEAQKGRYDTRDIAREFAKAQMNYYAQHAPSDGGVFTPVEGEDDTAESDGDLPPQQQELAKLREQGATRRALKDFAAAIKGVNDPDTTAPTIALIQLEGAIKCDRSISEFAKAAALELARELVDDPAKPKKRILQMNEALATGITDSASNGKANVMLMSGKDDENATKLLRGLQGKVPLYSRDRRLSTIATTAVQSRPQIPGQGTPVNDRETVAFVPASPDWLVAKFARYCDCRRVDADGNLRPASPPHREAKLIIASPDTWGVPIAHQIAESPFLRPDGRIVTTQGYDSESKVVLHSSVKLPDDMPTEPSRDDALSALLSIDSLFAEFPFVDDASRSVALSLVLTALTRNLMDVAPLHAITAPAPGTGKSELAAIATRIAQGRELPAQAVGADEAELGKRIDSAMFAGHPVIALDNVNGTLKGDSLCQAVSQPIYTSRILGKSEAPSCSNRATIIATGNNLRLPDDMVRRTILCSLDAGVERPEQRTFKRQASELKAEIERNRGAFVAAGLTIVRAFIHAVVCGSAPLAPEFPGFAAWSAYVRSPLIWLGRSDPIVTQAAVAADDPEAARRAAVFAAWHTLTDGKPAKVRDVLTNGSAFLPADDNEDDAAAEQERGDARIVLREQCHRLPGRPGDEAIRYALGNYLARNKGVVSGGLRLAEAGRDRNKVLLWRTEPV